MKVPFRLAILAVTVGLLALTAGSLVVVGVVQSRRTIDLLKRAYLQQVAVGAAGEVARLPRRAENILLTHHALAEAGALPVRDPVALGQLFARVLEEAPDLAWLSYGDGASGRFAGANRIAPDQLVVNVSDPRENRGVPREYRVGRAGALTPYMRTPPLTEPYDPRTRRWYRRAVETPDSVVWMPPYLFAEGVRGVTAAVAVRGGPGGAVRGVLTADFSLDGIDRFLRSVQVGERGAVLLFTADGAFLAGAPGPGRDAVGQAMRGWTGPAALAGPSTPLTGEALVDGVKYDVVARPVSPGTGLDWTVVVSVPEADFLGTVYAHRRTAVVVGLVGAALAAAVGILVSTRIADSLGGVTAELERLATFTLGGTGLASSNVQEIALLQEAVGRLRASLRSFTRYAPEDIVRDVLVSGREAMLSGEEREVTLLFCDLRGFTRLAAGIRPDEVVAILNDHFDVLSALVAEHGGYVVDFLGDSLFAVFGAPQPSPDHAVQAVACAIEMQLARARRNADSFARGWPPLEIGIGVSTGPAVVGNMGSNLRIKYGVVGHAVNLAARIETLTVAGQVLVSGETRDALGPRLVADGPLEAEGKGVGAPMRMWVARRLEGPVPLELPAPVHDLVAMRPPLRADVRPIHGKQLGAETHAAEVLRVGVVGAEIRTRAPMSLLGSAELVLRWADGGSAALDGRIVGLSAEDADGRVALLRFEGLGWDTRARLEALSRSGGG